MSCDRNCIKNYYRASPLKAEDASRTSADGRRSYTSSFFRTKRSFEVVRRTDDLRVRAASKTSPFKAKREEWRFKTFSKQVNFCLLPSACMRQKECLCAFCLLLFIPVSFICLSIQTGNSTNQFGSVTSSCHKIDFF